NSLATWTTLSSTAANYSRPVVNSLGEIYTLDSAPTYSVSVLRKRDSSGAEIWNRVVDGTTVWTVGADQYGGVHVADDNGPLSRYDYDGNQVWDLTWMPAVVTSFILDSAGNRFYSLNSGAVGRIGTEPVAAPSISIPPQPLTVVAGSSASFSVGATG